MVEHTFDLINSLDGLVLPFVSTDSPEILDLAAAKGFPFDYLRPDELATDEAPVIDAVFHALDWLEEKHGFLPSKVLMLQPTSPLRTKDQVVQALDSFSNLGCKSLVSVHAMREHPYECAQLSGGDWTFLKTPATIVTRRQDYQEKFFYIDGSIYLATTDFLWCRGGFVLQGETELYEVDSRYSVDIDEPEDLAVADALLRLRSSLND